MILECKNIHKSFDNIEVLQGINLSLKKGEILTLLGSSGCGKSTLLRIISGLEEPNLGEININNKIVFNDKTDIPPQKRGISFVFQDYALFPHLSVEENIFFAMRKESKEQKEENLKKIAKNLQIDSLTKRYPHELSGGQQQRVAVARALAGKPEIILFDEPFSNLDAKLRQQLCGDLRALIKSLGIGAIFVTHDQREAFVLSDTIALMKNGIIMQHDEPYEMYEKPKNIYVAAFLGKINVLKKNPFDIKINENQLLGIRPEDVRYFKDSDKKDNDLVQAKGKIANITYVGSYKMIIVDIGENLIEVLANKHDKFSLEDEIYISIKKESIRVFDKLD